MKQIKKISGSPRKRQKRKALSTTKCSKTAVCLQPLFHPFLPSSHSLPLQYYQQSSVLILITNVKRSWIKKKYYFKSNKFRSYFSESSAHTLVTCPLQHLHPLEVRLSCKTHQKLVPSTVKTIYGENFNSSFNIKCKEKGRHFYVRAYINKLQTLQIYFKNIDKYRQIIDK